MPAGCLEKECRECEYYVAKDGILDCNVKNRLGLAKPEIGAFTTGETDTDTLKKKLEAKKKEVEKLEVLIKEEDEKSGSGNLSKV